MISIDENYERLRTDLNPSTGDNLSLFGVGDQCQSMTLSTMLETAAQSPLLENSGAHGSDHNISSTSESPSSKQTVIATDMLSTQLYDEVGKGHDSYKRRISWLESQLERQQQCYRKREQKLKQLYEEELDIVEEEYQQSMLDAISKHQNEVLIKKHNKRVRKESKSVSADLNAIRPGNQELEKVSTCSTGCNTESYLSPVRSNITLNTIESLSESEADLLHQKTLSIYSRLDKLIHRFNDCSLTIKALDKQEITAAGIKSPNKSRRQRKKQNRPQPVVTQLQQSNKQPNNKSAAADVSPVDSIEPSRQSSDYGSLPHTAQYSAHHDEEKPTSVVTDDGDAGWEVVKSRRQRRQRAYQNEACVIAVAINNVPEMRPQRKGSMPLKPDRCRQSSYASKLQYGRRNPKSSTSCTINSEIPTLASQTYKGSKKEMVSRMKKK